MADKLLLELQRHRRLPQQLARARERVRQLEQQCKREGIPV